MSEGFTQHPRVRFVGLERGERGGNEVEVRVTLAWEGATHTGAVTGERGGPIELRTAALATLAALAAIVPPEPGLRLAGVKQLRAFDAELTVVSVLEQSAGRRNFVGAVVTGDDPLRSAALAVLSALNRVLGSYTRRG